MSESDDDDWFDKDIDDIVQEVQKKRILANKESEVLTAPNENDPPQTSGALFAFEGDYGGNYTNSYGASKSGQNPKKVEKTTKLGSRSYVQGISFKKLSFISELAPLNVFLEVTQLDCGYFESFNEHNLSNEFIILSLNIFAKLCQLPLDEFKKNFLKTFVQSENLLKEIEKLLSDILSNNIKKGKKTLFLVNMAEIVRDVVEICKNVARYNLVDEHFKKFLTKILNKFQTTTSGNYSKPKDEITKLVKSINSNELRMKEIYPTLDELKTKEIFENLKPNIVKGKYESLKHYLEIHSELLREDFIQPLRETIEEIGKFEKLEHIPSKRLYKKVKFMINNSMTAKTRKGEMLVVDLKADERSESGKNASPENTWVNPKKLMFGSLLCFTSSLSFDDLILATVSNRDIDSIIKGYIHVEIMKMYNVTKVFEKEFLMLESEVYFEPYHFVHRVLNSLDETNFPMAEYIVNVDKITSVPDYLKPNDSISYKYRGFTFNPLRSETYPLSGRLKLDNSQMEAYQHALSRKFSLIQGPPGTGKTYIGLEIVSTLLQNIDAQVLIISYTNHALDQFLTGILNITTDIVRMGNQSKHDLLDKYNIKQISDATITDRRLKSCIFHLKGDYMKLMHEFESLQNNYTNSEECDEKILKTQDKLKRISRKLDELKHIADYNFIKDKKVIGMTTTFAARSSTLLQLLKTPIVIVEEAAEVLESHIIASITKATQHLILIGDHKQLRPSTSVYKLTEKYKMDISLFERMIKNDLNCVCLAMQYRMRPDVADLIRPTIYPNLLDNENVCTYDNIRGVAKNMFFVNHSVPETQLHDEATKRNIHEAQFLIAFANYLLMQEYKPEDIIILTTYNGQMVQLLNERKHFPNLQKVRITVVDNFQGEEGRIILLSLVRSNAENSIGYIGMQNRICVSLSRAREGLYVIGNMSFLSKNSIIWNEIVNKLEDKHAIGYELPLKCTRHGNFMNMKSPTDFEAVKYGGCQQRCEYLFRCGHTCGYMCHWSGFEHLSDCNCDEIN